MFVTSTLIDALATTIKEVAASLMEKTLNDLVTADPGTMHSIMETRFYCKKAIETDTLAVPMVDPQAEGALQLGALGVMNAIAGLHGLLIVGQYGDDGRLTGFKVEVVKDKVEVVKDGNKAAG